jgi:thioredoxin-like negative regulator of GroEL
MAQLNRNRELSLLHLLYFRPTNAQCTALDEKLFALAARHRGAFRLVVKHSDERGHLFGGWVSGEAPTVLFVHDGRTMAQMVGDLPTHEIERLLRSALSCNPSAG